MPIKNAESFPGADRAMTPCDLFLSYRDALNRFCDTAGIASWRNSAITILNSAAANTVHKMETVGPAECAQMHDFETKIPEMFYGLLTVQIRHSLSVHVDIMSALSLDELTLVLRNGNPIIARCDVPHMPQKQR